MCVKKLFSIVGAGFCLLLIVCSRTENNAPMLPRVFVPEAPSYADSLMWYVDRSHPEHEADVFYVPSTWEYDWYTSDSMLCHYADPSQALHREHMCTEMAGVAAYMAQAGRFYSPHYRHISLDSWATLNEDTIRRRYQDVAWPDVQNAFSYYLAHYNQGRPFILAGFSQGGKSVVELLKVLPARLRHRMIAAYVLGYKVTPQDVEAAPWISPAQGEGDTGVTICYNSVSDVKYLKPVVSAPNVMCINPVNWKTDGTPATLHDTITVTLSVPHKVLVLEGYDGSALPNILDVLNVGDYHGVEPWIYSECLKENMQLRIRNYLGKSEK